MVSSPPLIPSCRLFDRDVSVSLIGGGGAAGALLSCNPSVSLTAMPRGSFRMKFQIFAPSLRCFWYNTESIKYFVNGSFNIPVLIRHVPELGVASEPYLRGSASPSAAPFTLCFQVMARRELHRRTILWCHFVPLLNIIGVKYCEFAFIFSSPTRVLITSDDCYGFQRKNCDS